MMHVLSHALDREYYCKITILSSLYSCNYSLFYSTSSDKVINFLNILNYLTVTNVKKNTNISTLQIFGSCGVVVDIDDVVFANALEIIILLPTLLLQNNTVIISVLNYDINKHDFDIIVSNFLNNIGINFELNKHILIIMCGVSLPYYRITSNVDGIFFLPILISAISMPGNTSIQINNSMLSDKILMFLNNMDIKFVKNENMVTVSGYQILPSSELSLLI